MVQLIQLNITYGIYRLLANEKEAVMANEVALDESKLLSTLAEGVDPFTGERMPGGHLLQHPQVVRALFHAAGALEHQKKSAKRVASLPAKAGMPWSKEEEEQLIREFENNAALPDIAQQHGRSEAGITSRLVKLGKISESENGYPAGKVGRPMKANPSSSSLAGNGPKTSERIRQ